MVNRHWLIGGKRFFMKQKHRQDHLQSIVLFPSDIDNLFMLALWKFEDNGLKNHDINLGEMSINNEKNTYKK